MCLAIPARLVEYVDADRMYGKVELGGVHRRINTSLLVGEDATEPGEYVLVHVGFALSRVSETEAAETLGPRVVPQPWSIPMVQAMAMQAMSWPQFEHKAARPTGCAASNIAGLNIIGVG